MLDRGVSEAWTVLRVLEWTTSRFDRAGLESPRLEAQVLLSHALGCSRVELYTSFDKPMGEDERAAFRALIQKRLRGSPVAYLVGEREFWSRSFRVDERVLIPRSDTETLIEAVLGAVEGGEGELDVLEIGTGSGAIAVTLAAELPRARVVATDISEDALEIARENAQRHGVAERVAFLHGDLLAPLGEATFDVVVANLPYIPTGDLERLQLEVRSEPLAALDGGAQGLDLLARVIADLGARLRDGGMAFFEHGFDQGQAVRSLLDDAGLGPASTILDLGGRERITVVGHERAEGEG